MAVHPASFLYDYRFEEQRFLECFRDSHESYLVSYEYNIFNTSKFVDVKVRYIKTRIEFYYILGIYLF